VRYHRSARNPEAEKEEQERATLEIVRLRCARGLVMQISDGWMEGGLGGARAASFCDGVGIMGWSRVGAWGAG